MKKLLKIAFFILLCNFINLILIGEPIPKQKGFPACSDGEIYGQIKVANLLLDEKKELIFGAVDGRVHVYKADGKEITTGMNTSDTPQLILWPAQTGGPIMSSVEVADLDGDGKQEVIATSYDNKIYIFNSTGFRKAVMDLGGTASFNTPVIADLDGNGDKEIVCTSWGGKLKVFNKRGELLWEQHLGARISAPPVVKDLDCKPDSKTKARKQEIIVKTDTGYINVFKANGRNQPGFPKRVSNPTGYWPTTPVAADLDGDGEREILVPATHPPGIVVLSDKGNILKKIKLKDDIADTLLIEDADKDGNPDILFASENGKIGIINVQDTMRKSGDSVFPVYLPGFPKKVAPFIQAVPQFTDINGDGEREIIYTAYNPKAKGKKVGWIGAIDLNGRKIEGFPLYIGKTLSRLTISDIDNDGDMELIVAGGIARTALQLHVFDCQVARQIKIAIIGRIYE